MQKSVFTHFGAGLGQEGVAGSAAANFTSTSKASKNELSLNQTSTNPSKGELSKLGLIAKAFKVAFSKAKHGVSGAFGRLFALSSSSKSLVYGRVSAFSRARVVNSKFNASFVSLS